MSVFCFLPANMGVPVLTSMEDTPVCVKMDGLAQTVKWVGSLEIISYCNVCFNSWVMWCHFMKNKEKEFFYYPIIYPYNFDFMISNIIMKCTVYKMKLFFLQTLMSAWGTLASTMEVVSTRMAHTTADVQWDGRDPIVWMVSFIIDKIYIKFYFNLF